MAFKCDGYKDFKVELQQDDEDVIIKVNGITVAFFAGDTNKLVLVEIFDNELAALKGMPLVERRGDYYLDVDVE